MERDYECMVIIKPGLQDSEQEEIFQKIIKKTQSLDGRVSSSQVWAKERDLCFSLKSHEAEKKKYNKGCYWLINFSLNTEKLSELKETIRLEERILRSLILKKD